MGRKSKKKASFFKVLSNMDFTKLLRLPPSFSRSNDVSENVKMRAAYSERKWNVKVERRGNNGVFCFTDGWPKFAKDAALQLGEFLVFFQVTKSEFEVVIYETSCCQRNIPPPPPPTRSYVKRETARNRAADICSGEFGSKKRKGLLYFEKRLKFHHKWRFYLPAEFSKAANMIGREQVRVEYVPNHNSQCVGVENGPHPYRFDLAKGWAPFRKANKLQFGNNYSFEFHSDDNVIRVNQV